MKEPVQKRIIIYAISGIAIALLAWTILFYRNPILKAVLSDIHLIFISTLSGFILIKIFIPGLWVDMLKIFIRTMFRVWLLIFITFAISKSMERVGFILSITFIFGYFEALLDIDKWQQHNDIGRVMHTGLIQTNNYNQAFVTVTIMSLVHCLCAFFVWIFYLVY